LTTSTPCHHSCLSHHDRNHFLGNYYFFWEQTQNQAGWSISGFTMIFFRVFGSRSDPMAMLDFSGELSSVKEKVVKVNHVQASRKSNPFRPPRRATKSQPQRSNYRVRFIN
jgi:hypothetical protein